MEKKACIAMVPSPALSHLIPLVEFAKLLVQQHNDFHVTFLIPTLDYPLQPSMQSILNTLPPSNIDFTILPQVQDFPENLPSASKMKLIVQYSIPFLQEAIKSLISKTNLVGLVFSMFSTDVHDVAKQFNLPSYLFYASGALVFSLLLSFPNIDETVPISSEFLKSTYEQVSFPGSVIPFHVKDIPNPLLAKRTSETYTSFLDVCQKFSLVDGVIVNTFTDFEPEAIRALQEKGKPCVYPVGPIIRGSDSNNETTNMPLCLEWLEKQPQSSVLYVSFGSGGTLSHEQLNELAFGLEMSGHKFLWVVRPPNKSANSAYFGGQKENNIQEYLPSGFLDRTKEQGLVVPSWAPQIEVLGHRSTGGFLSHCGWSSTLESVVNGVPMIAWPLFAEQNMNAITLTDLLKVALRPKVDEESGVVKREEVAKTIKRIMEGEESLELHKRIKELSVAAAAALSDDGSSKKALSTLALKWH